MSERLGGTGRHEQSVDAVGDDLADPADGGRDHRRADRKRLDRGVREVLPVAGEDRRLRPREGVEHLLPRQGADEAHAAVQPGVVGVPLQAGTVGTVADDRQRGRRHVRQSVEGDMHRLLPSQAPREDETGPLGRRRRPRRRRRVRHDVQALRIEIPTARDLGEVAARDDQRPGARAAHASALASARSAACRPRAGSPRASRRRGPSGERARTPGRRRASQQAVGARPSSPPRPRRRWTTRRRGPPRRAARAARSVSSP